MRRLRRKALKSRGIRGCLADAYLATILWLVLHRAWVDSDAEASLLLLMGLVRRSGHLGRCINHPTGYVL